MDYLYGEAMPKSKWLYEWETWIGIGFFDTGASVVRPVSKMF